MLHDVSQPVTPGAAHFPGDEPFSCGWTLDSADLHLGWVKTSPHVGTHVDAPYHYALGDRRVGGLDLDVFAGACTILDARGAAELDARLWRGVTLAPRVLFRTRERDDPNVFHDRFPILTRAAVADLARAGVRLVGVDAPSVDPVDAKRLAVHHALGEAGIVNVENLALARAPVGACELIAFPVAWTEMDAAPVRAIVRT